MNPYIKNEKEEVYCLVLCFHNL